MTADVYVVGIGADGWAGLGDAARAELSRATTVFGSARQLDYLPTSVTANRVRWSSPMASHLDEILAAPPSTPIHVLASGDPMFHGVGTSIIRRIGADRVRVLPTVSSAALAASRLGWNLAQVHVRSVVDAPVESVLPACSDGVRLLILSRDAQTPGEVARLLRDNGFGWSSVTVLGELGGPGESRHTALARSFGFPDLPALNIVAVDCVGPTTSRQAGLEDTAFGGDGQLTKQAIRALTLSALAPAPGQLLWDVGAGSGSIAIEWCRSETTCTAIAFEANPTRRDTVVANAQTLGVTGITVRGSVPEALSEAPDPDAIFIGGGLTANLVATCWESLLEGGRIVVNAVTWESESLVQECYRRYGGQMRRCQIDHGAPLGSMTTWRAQLPIVQWIAQKPRCAEPVPEASA